MKLNFALIIMMTTTTTMMMLMTTTMVVAIPSVGSLFDKEFTIRGTGASFPGEVSD